MQSLHENPDLCSDDPRIDEREFANGVCAIDTITLTRNDNCTLLVKDLCTIHTPPSIFNISMAPLKRAARGKVTEDPGQVRSFQCVCCCTCAGGCDTVSRAACVLMILQVRLLDGVTYSSFLNADEVVDEPGDAVEGVATSAVRAGQVVAPRFSRHINLRPCLEVEHKDDDTDDVGRFCCDVLCAFTSKEARTAARSARKSSSKKAKEAAVTDVPVFLFVQWWAAAPLPSKVVPGGVLSRLTNVYSILPLCDLVLFRRVLVVPQLGPLAFKGHVDYAAVQEDVVVAEDGRKAVIRRRFAVLVDEPYFCV